MHDSLIGAALPTTSALAYIGDARHSLYVRKMLAKKGICKSGELNEASLLYVTAEAQAEMMRKIKPMLLDDELEVYRRASNSTHVNRPKPAKAADYRAASGFEAVLGMLEWIGDGERLSEILKLAHTEDIENDTEN